MASTKKYTVTEVRDLFNAYVTDNMAATDEGQAHLNRIGKAITNESIELRKDTQKKTYATAAFNKALADLASKTPDKVSEFLANKESWINKHIRRKYGTDEL